MRSPLFLFCFLVLKATQPISPRTASAPIVAPIPIPAFAPVESPLFELGAVEDDVGGDVDVADEENEEDVLLEPITAAIVIAPEVPQHAVLFLPQHQVVEAASFPQGLICTLLLES